MICNVRAPDQIKNCSSRGRGDGQERHAGIGVCQGPESLWANKCWVESISTLFGSLITAHWLFCLVGAAGARPRGFLPACPPTIDTQGEQSRRGEGRLVRVVCVWVWGTERGIRGRPIHYFRWWWYPSGSNALPLNDQFIVVLRNFTVHGWGQNNRLDPRTPFGRASETAVDISSLKSGENTNERECVRMCVCVCVCVCVCAGGGGGGGGGGGHDGRRLGGYAVLHSCHSLKCTTSMLF